MNLAFYWTTYRSLETDGYLGKALWTSHISHLTRDIILQEPAEKQKKNDEIQSLPVDYLSGGRDLIHRLLFPEVPLARYVSWPQILMNRKQKTIHTWALIFSGDVYINHVCCLFESMFYLIHVI